MFYTKSDSRKRNLFLSLILFGCFVFSGIEQTSSYSSHENNLHREEKIVQNQNTQQALFGIDILIFRVEGWLDGRKGSRGYLFGWKIWDTY